MIRCHAVKVDDEVKTLRGSAILFIYTHIAYLLIYFSISLCFYMTRFILPSFMRLRYHSALCLKLFYACISCFLPLTLFLSSYFCSFISSLLYFYFTVPLFLSFFFIPLYIYRHFSPLYFLPFLNFSFFILTIPLFPLLISLCPPPLSFSPLFCALLHVYELSEAP